MVVVFRGLFPSGKAGEDDGATLEAFGAVDGKAGDGGRSSFALRDSGVLHLRVAGGGWDLR